MVADGGLEGFRCLAVEGARVGRDPGGEGRPSVGLGRGGGRLEGVTGEGGLYTLLGTGLISFTASNLQSTTPTPWITL